MSDQITQAMVDTFNDGIEMLAQQMQPLLAGKVREESRMGERNSFDQVGVVAAQKKTTRNADTRYHNTPHKRRWVTTDTYDLADLLDKSDVIRILNEPSGEYAESFVAALNRAKDANVLEAALGPAFTGKKGTVVVPFPAGNVIPDGATGFTFAKVQEAMTRLKQGNAVSGNEEMYIAWTAVQEKEFLQIPEVTSVDYNTQRVLMKGGMGEESFYGFQYVRLEDWTDDLGTTYEIVPKSGAVRRCVAWVKNGLLHNQPAPPQTTEDRLPGKRNSRQIYTWADFGSTRMQESKVIEIQAQE